MVIEPTERMVAAPYAGVVSKRPRIEISFRVSHSAFAARF